MNDASHTPRTSSALLDGWRMSMGTLTAIPVTPPSRIDRRVAGWAMVLAPVAALPLAAIWALGAVLCRVVPQLPTLPVAAVTISAVVLATRAMHLDGLADTCDGLSASYDREKAFAVMKTGDVGPSGAAAIAMTLLVEVGATAAVYDRSSLLAIVLGALAVCTSRAALVVACRRGVPAARPRGLGATVAGTVSGAALFLVLAALLLVGTLVSVVLDRPVWPPVVLVPTTAVSAWVVVRHCTRRLGGINGDVLGAAIEISAAVGLTTAACLLALV